MNPLPQKYFLSEKQGSEISSPQKPGYIKIVTIFINTKLKGANFWVYEISGTRTSLRGPIFWERVYHVKIFPAANFSSAVKSLKCHKYFFTCWNCLELAGPPSIRPPIAGWIGCCCWGAQGMDMKPDSAPAKNLINFVLGNLLTYD